MLLLLLVGVLNASSGASPPLCKTYNEDQINEYGRKGFVLRPENAYPEQDAKIKLHWELQQKSYRHKYFIKLEDCFLKPPEHTGEKSTYIFVHKNHFRSLYNVMSDLLQLPEGERGTFYHRVFKLIQFFDSQGIITPEISTFTIGFRTTDRTFANPIIDDFFEAFKNTVTLESLRNYEIDSRKLISVTKDGKRTVSQIKELTNFLYELEEEARKVEVEKQKPKSDTEKENSLHNLLLEAATTNEWVEKGYKAMGKALRKFATGKLNQKVDLRLLREPSWILRS